MGFVPHAGAAPGRLLYARTGETTTNAVSLAFERAKGNKNTLRTPERFVLPDNALAPGWPCAA